MPPAKIFIAALVDEFEILAVTYRSAIDREILEPNFVCRLLVVPGEVFGVRRLDAAFVSYALPYGRATAPIRVSKFKQSPFNLNHAAHVLNGSRPGFHWPAKLITEQGLDVVTQQLLMLHLVFKPEPYYLE